MRSAHGARTRRSRARPRDAQDDGGKQDRIDFCDNLASLGINDTPMIINMNGAYSVQVMDATYFALPRGRGCASSLIGCALCSPRTPPMVS